ncbi:GNAT family N-acetyltransferase [Christensenellaceae bacterium OttesenSCG-928-K19]|nr:GNAT family N-acetyltransferase [Christensenellaceae bacterium OttesenSCG-928-K19]
MTKNILMKYNHNRLPITSDFSSFFSLLERSFPLKEFRTKEGQQSLFLQEEYQLMLLKNTEDAVLALLSYWDFPGFYFIEHFAVDPDFRGGGIGGKLLHKITQQAEKDIFLEVAPPSSNMAKRRIAFYERNGFVLNDYDHVQPPLRPGSPSIPLRIMSYPQRADRKTLRQTVDILYQYVYQI